MCEQLEMLPLDHSQAIVEMLLGSTLSAHDAAQSFDLTYCQVMEMCNKAGIEQCETCGQWAEFATMDSKFNCEDCAYASDENNQGEF